MLKEFRVSNFRSFKDEILFTMEPDFSNVSEHPNHIIENQFGDKVLKVASIYGPNAGGKTNLLKAINSLSSLLLQKRIPKELINDFLVSSYFSSGIEPFVFSSEKNNKMGYSVFFIDDFYEFGYSIKFEWLDNKEIDLYQVIEEHLSYRVLQSKEFIPLFDRDSGKITCKYLFEEVGVTKFTVSDNIPLVWYLFDNHVNKNSENPTGLGLIYSFYQQIKAINFEMGLDVNFAPDFIFASPFLRNEKLKKKVIEMLNKLDISISDIQITNNKKRGYDVKCKHLIGNQEKYLPLFSESEGTKSLILILPKMISLIEEGGILLVDELDAHLHPKLIQKIVELYNSDINHKSQLIFNSHDICNMTKDNFRRDEIWFVYRDEQLSSEIVCLSDFIDYKGNKLKVRKDAKYSKQYLEGRYGADPFVYKGIIWDE